MSLTIPNIRGDLTIVLGKLYSVLNDVELNNKLYVRDFYDKIGSKDGKVNVNILTNNLSQLDFVYSSLYILNTVVFDKCCANDNFTSGNLNLLSRHFNAKFKVIKNNTVNTKVDEKYLNSLKNVMESYWNFITDCNQESANPSNTTKVGLFRKSYVRRYEDQSKTLDLLNAKCKNNKTKTENLIKLTKVRDDRLGNIKTCR